MPRLGASVLSLNTRDDGIFSCLLKIIEFIFLSNSTYDWIFYDLKFTFSDKHESNIHKDVILTLEKWIVRG